MPSLQEIRQFNHRLISMGDEPEVVREWGEELEDVPVPEAGLDEDVSSLLSDTGAEGEGEPPEERPDFSQLLGEDLEAEELEAEPEAPPEPEEEETEEEPEPQEEEPSPVGGIEEGDFSDFAALLGEEPEAAEAPEEDFDLEETDEFSLPEGGFSLDEEPAPEEATPEEPTAEEPTAEEPDFGDLSGFEFSDEEPGEETFGGEEDFSFEEPSVPGVEGGFEDVGELDEVEEGELDEFSLGDFGEEFGVIEEEGPSDEDLNPAINIPEVAGGAPEAAGAAPGEFQLSDEEFDRLQRTLSGLPLNLKQEVEQIVAEARGTTDQVEHLVRMLVAGESAQDIANFAGRILGRRIRIPRSYEKRSGEQFEEERRSFAYQFRENIWPILRLATILVVAAGVLAVAGYNFVVRPLHARSLYVEGLELIEADQYSLGNQTFDRAWDVWPNSDWYYDYAEAFSSERQYALAEQKYQELLFGRDPAIREVALEALNDGNYAAVVANHELPKRGVLDYAELESEVLGNYRQAERLISLILFQDTNDYDARLALGDTYMRWADEDPARYEDARLAYARLVERYGQTDELLFRMLGYFIAVDNLQEVITLKDAFQADPRARIDPEIYADLAGYLIDNDLNRDVEDVIFRALEVNNRIPELHYHLARYYAQIDALGEEELALQTARDLLRDAQPFTPERRGMLIDTHTRIGENQYDAGNYLDAQESFTTAIELYEQGRQRRILGADAIYARAYARLGDIFYYVGREYEQALVQYDQAEAAGYEDPDLDYKQGYVHYRGGRLDAALGEFRQAANDPSGTTNALLWATGNTHYRRDNLFASEAYYRELLDRVERERDSIRTLLVDEDPTHQSVIEYLYRGYNNLGVALFALSEETGDPDKYSQSLVYLTRSTELAENYQREPATLARSDAVDLAYLNQREALYPRPQFEMQIYNDLPEDLDDLLF